MKNRAFLYATLFACTFSLHINAQLVVSSSGNITMPQHIAIQDATPTDSIGLNAFWQTNAGNHDYGIYSKIEYHFEPYANTGRHVSVLGTIYVGAPIIKSPLSKGGMYGPFKAGVVGATNSGCGVYGSSNTSLPSTWNLGSFAGYFDGDAKVTGSLTAASVSTSSDIRFKDNISDIESSVLKSLASLRPVSYTFKRESMIYLNEGEEERTHYGFIAQDVKEILPDIVSEDGAGYLSVNYVELIPLLVQVLKQQQDQIDELQSILSSSQAKKMNKDAHAQAHDAPLLLQNSPNPFSQITKIGYYLPDETHEATIRIYDMSGTEIVAFPIDTSGNGELTIDGGTLRAGMYLYSLIADGQLIDTKQMILTK